MEKADQGTRGTTKRLMFGKRHQVKPKGITGIRDQGSRQQLRLRKKTTGNGICGWSRRQEPHLGSRTILNKTFRKTVVLEIAK
jgi:hypothetical protein